MYHGKVWRAFLLRYGETAKRSPPGAELFRPRGDQSFEFAADGLSGLGRSNNIKDLCSGAWAKVFSSLRSANDEKRHEGRCELLSTTATRVTEKLFDAGRVQNLPENHNPELSGGSFFSLPLLSPGGGEQSLRNVEDHSLQPLCHILSAPGLVPLKLVCCVASLRSLFSGLTRSVCSGQKPQDRAL